MEIRPFRSGDADAVISMWVACGLTRPWNDPRRDIDRKLTEQPELFLVADLEGTPVGTAMVGFDGHRGWVHYLAVDPARQGAGIGRALMDEAERRLTALGCPKIMLMVRDGNGAALGFYDRLGYRRDATVVLGKRLIPDT